MEPAHSIIAKFNGPTAMSKLLGIHRTRVHSWKRPKEAGGTGGIVPQKYHVALLQHAKANGLDLRPEHFLPVEFQAEDVA